MMYEWVTKAGKRIKCRKSLHSFQIYEICSTLDEIEDDYLWMDDREGKIETDYVFENKNETKNFPCYTTANIFHLISYVIL